MHPKLPLPLFPGVTCFFLIIYSFSLCPGFLMYKTTITTYLIKLSKGIDSLIHAKCLERCQKHRQCFVSVNYYF